jgi:hypothetical protein
METNPTTRRDCGPHSFDHGEGPRVNKDSVERGGHARSCEPEDVDMGPLLERIHDNHEADSHDSEQFNSHIDTLVLGGRPRAVGPDAYCCIRQ